MSKVTLTLTATAADAIREPYRALDRATAEARTQRVITSLTHVSPSTSANAFAAAVMAAGTRRKGEVVSISEKSLRNAYAVAKALRLFTSGDDALVGKLADSALALYEVSAPRLAEVLAHASVKDAAAKLDIAATAARAERSAKRRSATGAAAPVAGEPTPAATAAATAAPAAVTSDISFSRALGILADYLAEGYVPTPEEYALFAGTAESVEYAVTNALAPAA